MEGGYISTSRSIAYLDDSVSVGNAAQNLARREPDLDDLTRRGVVERATIIADGETGPARDYFNGLTLTHHDRRL